MRSSKAHWHVPYSLIIGRKMREDFDESEIMRAYSTRPAGCGYFTIQRRAARTLPFVEKRLIGIVSRGRLLLGVLYAQEENPMSRIRRDWHICG